MRCYAMRDTPKERAFHVIIGQMVFVAADVCSLFVSCMYLLYSTLCDYVDET